MKRSWFLFLAGMMLFCACQKKNEFLDKVPSTQLVLPTTLANAQAILDNEMVMQETPVLGEVSADNFYLSYSFWQTRDIKEQNAYIWAKDIYEGIGQVEDWDDPYEQVFYANVVLQAMPNISADSSTIQQWRAIVGTALFYRAYAFYNLVQVFAPAYDATTASTDLGIPLRTNPDINKSYPRASVADTYTKILSDLDSSVGYLPAAVQTAMLNRPSQPAALAMLARVYLSMRNYPMALTYATNCLQSYSTLINYNSITNPSYLPFTLSNAETMYQSRLLSSTQVLLGLVYPEECIVDSALYRSYQPGDLRKTIYYAGDTNTPKLGWSYNGGIYCFSGLATDEVYLIKAECEARSGDVNDAMTDLNTLMKNRWSDTVAFTPYTASNSDQALAEVLAERRKELAFRGLRWTDLKRLNKEGANIIVTRNLNGQVYTLAPNSNDYILPIPPDVQLPANPGR
jgi:hypothetical protein